MRKFIYIALLVITASLSFTSCTEEEVKPQVEISNSGGGGSEGPITK
jgi:hypothetical protein